LLIEIVLYGRFWAAFAGEKPAGYAVFQELSVAFYNENARREEKMWNMPLYPYRAYHRLKRMAGNEPALEVGV
jgi:hypothetical protein